MSLISDGWERVARRQPCPICGRTKYCLVHHARGLAACTHPDHASDVYWERLNAHLFRLDGGSVGSDWRDPIRPPRAEEPPAPEPTFDPDELHAAYAALLAACPLSDDHRAALRERGLTDVAIDAGGYGSLPADERTRATIVARVTAALGGDPVGRIPGFIRRADRSLGIYALPGLLVPARDRARRIVGVQVRVDDPAAAASGKYRWLSGGEAKGGISISGHTCHLALPPGPLRPWTRVVVTEGLLKADLTAARLHLPVIAIAGVANIDQVVDHLRRLGAPGDLEVCIAYDADKAENEQVARNERRLVRRVRDAGYRVVEWRWALADAKGLDDLLQLNLLPSPGLYPDDAPDDPAAAPTCLADLARQLDDARTENGLLNRIVGSKRLGGDVGSLSAIRIVNYAASYAAAHHVPIGGVVPLVKNQIAHEFYDPERGQWHAAVAPKTIGTAVERFVAHDLIETAPAKHVYVHAGVEREQATIGLVWRGRRPLLEQFANGSVYGDDETHKRGGKQDKRLPLVCPTCGETHAACVSCGAIFGSAHVVDHVVRLHEGHPGLVGEGDGDAADGAGPDWRTAEPPLPETGLRRESENERRDGHPGLVGRTDYSPRRAAARDDLAARGRAAPSPPDVPALAAEQIGFVGDGVLDRWTDPRLSQTG